MFGRHKCQWSEWEYRTEFTEIWRERHCEICGQIEYMEDDGITWLDKGDKNATNGK